MSQYSYSQTYLDHQDCSLLSDFLGETLLSIHAKIAQHFQVDQTDTSLFLQESNMKAGLIHAQYFDEHVTTLLSRFSMDNALKGTMRMSTLHSPIPAYTYLFVGERQKADLVLQVKQATRIQDELRIEDVVLELSSTLTRYFFQTFFEKAQTLLSHYHFPSDFNPRYLDLLDSPAQIYAFQHLHDTETQKLKREQNLLRDISKYTRGRSVDIDLTQEFKQTVHNNLLPNSSPEYKERALVFSSRFGLKQNQPHALFMIAFPPASFQWLQTLLRRRVEETMIALWTQPFNES